LLDQEGHFHKTPRDAIARIDAVEAEIELRAQIETALAYGIRPTHLDSHQWILYSTQLLIECLVRLGREFCIPISLAKNLLKITPAGFSSTLHPGEAVLDCVLSIGPNVEPRQWWAYYERVIRVVPKGISEIVFHPAYDDEEMRAFTRDRETWGAAWRQRDFDILVSTEFSNLLQANSVELISWREIGLCHGVSTSGNSSSSRFDWNPGSMPT
jgi:predicted glycoside hydrolase/deacetylase ChbG (UPF0249 family)